MKKINLSYTTQLLILTAVYFLTGKFGLEIQAVSEFATLVWFPTGIALAVLFLYGRQLWPGVFLGAFFLNLTTGAPFFPALGIAVGNTLEAVVGAYILTKFVKFQSSLERMRDVLGLTLFAAPLSTFISATIGVSSLWLGGVVPGANFVPTWLTWWVGDLLSDFIFAPFLFVWLTGTTVRIKERYVIEKLGLMALIIISSVFVFTSKPEGNPISYLVFPGLIWAAIRFNPRIVMTNVFVISILATLATIYQLGPFANGNLNQNLLYLQTFMTVVSFSSMLFAGLVSERNRFEQRKDDFISMASHELKTPVTSVKIYLDILTRKIGKSEKDDSMKLVSNIKGQIEKLQEIVSDLLDASRIETEKLQFEMEDFQLDELIHEVLDALQPSTNKHKLIYKNPKPTSVYGDKFRIYQVLTNLLTNAIKYAPKKGEIITRMEKQKDKIVVSVQDFGVGIAEEQQKKVFDQFYQVDDPKEKTFPGLGIGLYITKEIVTRHGGDIWVESEKGKGSTFYFTLPV